MDKVDKIFKKVNSLTCSCSRMRGPQCLCEICSWMRTATAEQLEAALAELRKNDGPNIENRTED